MPAKIVAVQIGGQPVQKQPAVTVALGRVAVLRGRFHPAAAAGAGVTGGNRASSAACCRAAAACCRAITANVSGVGAG